MSHKAHKWRPGQPPPTIQPHSRAKHRLLEAYLRRYVETLTQNIRVDRLRLTVVDGFAGGNIYTDPSTGGTCRGSPSIVLDALREAEVKANVRRKKPFKLLDHCFFIEKDWGAFDSLKATLAAGQHSKSVDQTIHLMKGEFDSHVGGITSFINAKSRTGRSLFILDQFGFSQVPFRTIRNIFASIPNAEVVLTFAAEDLIDHLSDNKPNPKLRLNPGLDLDSLASKIDKANPLWKRLIQTELHGVVQKLADAKYFTPFFLRCKESHRDLWLVHLSRHHRARDVMVGVHWDLQNTFAHYGKSGLNMLLGYDQDEDFMFTGQSTFEAFLFDAVAAERTKAALTEELPKLLRDHHQEVSFRTLFATISNQIPATSQQVRDVFRILSAEERVLIRDETKLVTRTAGIQRETDLIITPPQRHLFC